MHYLVQI